MVEVEKEDVVVWVMEGGLEAAMLLKSQSMMQCMYFRCIDHYFVHILNSDILRDTLH